MEQATYEIPAFWGSFIGGTVIGWSAIGVVLWLASYESKNFWLKYMQYVSFLLAGTTLAAFRIVGLVILSPGSTISDRLWNVVVIFVLGLLPIAYSTVKLRPYLKKISKSMGELGPIKAT